MAASALNKNGSPVNVGDHVSITAKVVSYTGSGSKASVIVQSPLDAGTYTIQANDAFAVEQPSDSLHTAVSFEGNWYGVKGDDITVLGLVTAISGSGVNALLTVTLISSLNSITTAAGNCTSDNV
jgi:predicted extracellular nuclease